MQSRWWGWYSGSWRGNILSKKFQKSQSKENAEMVCQHHPTLLISSLWCWFTLHFCKLHFCFPSRCHLRHSQQGALKGEWQTPGRRRAFLVSVILCSRWPHHSSAASPRQRQFTLVAAVDSLFSFLNICKSASSHPIEPPALVGQCLFFGGLHPRATGFPLWTERLWHCVNQYGSH